MTDYIAGFTHYDTVRDPEDHLVEKVLPADPEGVHAVWRGRPPRPQFLDRLYYETALCGRLIKVLLPLQFDPQDPDACHRCVGAALRGDFPPEDPREARMDADDWRSRQADETRMAEYDRRPRTDE